MKFFSDHNEIIKFSRDFVKNRINSLEKDVRYCLRETNFPIQYAPFPALLYCFATIDLLGALLEGDASENAQTKNNSIRYMNCFMNYTKEQANLLIRIFRHKLVHLARPKFVYTDNNQGKKIIWRYYHDNPEKHLRIEELDSTINITSTYKIHATHQFNLGIMQFMVDIKDSVERPNGYLHTLEITSDLQTKFVKAIEQIYED
jgi:hypothetical protein